MMDLLKPIRTPYQLVSSERRFRWLWLGNLVSAVGTSVAALALPITALMLGATPFEMGVITALAAVPSLLFGLPSGVIADRLARGRLMIVSDLARAAIALTVPICYVADVLTVPVIYAVAFAGATFTLLFDVTSTSALADVLDKSKLLDGNVSMSLNTYFARTAGPSAAGFLIGAIGAPLVMIVDAASFVASALSCHQARLPDHRTTASVIGGYRSWLADLREGVRYSVRDPLLRSILGASALGSLALSFQQPVLLYFLNKDLDLPPQVIGLLFGVSGIVSTAGALLARAASDRFGLGRSVGLGTFLVVLGMAAIAAASGPTPVAIAVICGGQLLMGIGAPIYVINQLTARQSSVPTELQGRANATRRFVMYGATPIGALLSGVVAESLGSRSSLAVAAAFMAAALIWTVRSPLWAMRISDSNDTVTP